MMIREMTAADLESVLKLDAGAFQPKWSLDMFSSELNDNPFAYLYVWVEEAEICGFIDFWITFETAQLANIAVAKHCQGQGIGLALMKEMIRVCNEQMCDNITLEVHVDNQRAISLYEHYGFIKASLRKGYYEDGCDAHLMIMPLGGNYV